MKSCNRRYFVKGAVVGGAWLCSPLVASGAEGDERQTASITDLGDGAFLITRFGNNVVGLEGPDSQLLVDGVEASHAQDLIAILDARSGGKPVSDLYNTHWHWENSGSNEVFKKRGANIIAHENTRLWLGNTFYVPWQNRHYPARPEQALPTDTFYQDHSQRFAGEAVESVWLPQAHTDGDIYVHLPERNILITGDLVADGVFPIMDPATGGWIGGLVDAQARLLELCDDETRIIPGMGDVMSRSDLVAQHAMLLEMRERIFELVKQGKSAADMLAEDVSAGFEAWGDPVQFVENAYAGLWKHYSELDGVI